MEETNLRFRFDYFPLNTGTSLLFILELKKKKKKSMEKTVGWLLIQMSEIGCEGSQTVERAET